MATTSHQACCSALPVPDPRYADMAAFRAATRDLEQQLAGILASAATQAASLPARLDVIEACAQTATCGGLR